MYILLISRSLSFYNPVNVPRSDTYPDLWITPFRSTASDGYELFFFFLLTGLVFPLTCDEIFFIPSLLATDLYVSDITLVASSITSITSLLTLVMDVSDIPTAHPTR